MSVNPSPAQPGSAVRAGLFLGGSRGSGTCRQSLGKVSSPGGDVVSQGCVWEFLKLDYNVAELTWPCPRQELPAQVTSCEKSSEPS